MTTNRPNLLFDLDALKYTNNTEYRAALRQFFRMNHCIVPQDCPTGILDSETADELLYDTDTTMRGIQAIYDATKYNPQFMALYLRAAGRIFSEDAVMGLTLLFCYDHFAGFVPVLAEVWNGDGVVETVKYQTLYDSV
jgi:hypothetical protein